MNDLVAEETHEECQDSDDNDTGVSGNAWVDGIDELRADNRVDTGPSDAG